MLDRQLRDKEKRSVSEIFIQKFVRGRFFFVHLISMTASQNESGNVVRPKPLLSRGTVKILATSDGLCPGNKYQFLNSFRDAPAEGKSWSNLWDKSDALAVEIDLSAAPLLNVLPGDVAPEFAKVFWEEKEVISTIPDAKESIVDWKSFSLPADADAVNDAVQDDEEEDDDDL
jgi:hypothetical protein